MIMKFNGRLLVTVRRKKIERERGSWRFPIVRHSSWIGKVIRGWVWPIWNTKKRCNNGDRKETYNQLNFGISFIEFIWFSPPLPLPFHLNEHQQQGKVGRFQTWSWTWQCGRGENLPTFCTKSWHGEVGRGGSLLLVYFWCCCCWNESEICA